jgi:hypothetical protein
VRKKGERLGKRESYRKKKGGERERERDEQQCFVKTEKHRKVTEL